MVFNCFTDIGKIYTKIYTKMILPDVFRESVMCLSGGFLHEWLFTHDTMVFFHLSWNNDLLRWSVSFSDVPVDSKVKCFKHQVVYRNSKSPNHLLFSLENIFDEYRSQCDRHTGINHLLESCVCFLGNGRLPASILQIQVRSHLNYRPSWV